MCGFLATNWVIVSQKRIVILLNNTPLQLNYYLRTNSYACLLLVVGCFQSNDQLNSIHIFIIINCKTTTSTPYQHNLFSELLPLLYVQPTSKCGIWKPRNKISATHWLHRSQDQLFNPHPESSLIKSMTHSPTKQQ